MEVLDVLEQAKRSLENDGWIKGQWTDEDGRVCIVGAMWNVWLGSDDEKDFLDDAATVKALELLAREAYPRLGKVHKRDVDEQRGKFRFSELVLMTFNDASRTRKKDVIEVFDLAIADERARREEMDGDVPQVLVLPPSRRVREKVEV